MRYCSGGQQLPQGEGAGAFAQQNGDSIVLAVGNHQILLSILIDIRNGQGVRRIAYVSVDASLEGTVAVSQKHGNTANCDARRRRTIVVDDSYVAFRVAVEIGNHDGCRIDPRGIVNASLKAAIAIRQQHRHGVLVEVGDDEIEPTIPIDVSVYHRLGIITGGQHRGIEDVGLSQGVGTDRDYQAEEAEDEHSLAKASWFSGHHVNLSLRTNQLVPRTTQPNCVTERGNSLVQVPLFRNDVWQ